MAGLFTEFPPVSDAQWDAAILADSKGADPEKLVWRTEDGIPVKPFYRAGSPLAGQAPLWTAQGNRWEIRAEVPDGDPAAANSRARRIVERGISALSFRAVGVRTAGDLKALLEGLPVERITLHFQCASGSARILELLESHPGARDISGSAACDPISDMAAAGVADGIIDNDRLTEAAAGFQNALRTLPKVTPLAAGTTLFHDAGATAAGELALALASGAEYLAQFSARSVAARDVAGHLAFQFSTGSSYFQEIAKLRAMRTLWPRVCGAFDPAAASLPLRLDARTSDWNQSAFDPHVNLLRGTTEAMAAVLGGATSLTVRPFTGNWAEPDETSLRLAVNTQLLLRDEAWFDKVADPAAGSWYIEELTDALARKAWRMFQDIESEGGLLEALSKGVIQNMVRASRESREALIAQRRKVFVGVNAYPNAQERVAADPAAPVSEGPFPAGRGPAMWERLRLAAQQAAKRPKVLLLASGDAKMRRARADFSANFFACGGFEIVHGTALADAADADLVVLCSSDAEYPALAAEICGHSPVPVMVAGLPKDSVEQLKAAGVADFIHIRANAREVLGRWQKKLGV